MSLTTNRSLGSQETSALRAAAKKLDCMWKWLGKQNKTKNTTSARELKLLTQALGKTKQKHNK